MKLTFSQNENSYTVNRKKPFNGIPIQINDLSQAFEFAYTMCFGEGHHRNHRTGGQYGRKNGELFCNTFQGKLAEIVLFNYFISNGIECDKPDFGIYGEGIWDDSDLIINGNKINVKSAAYFSDLLLLETKDWNETGQYIPNLNNGTTINYDYFILIRIQPDIKKLLRNNHLYYSEKVSRDILEKIIFNETYKYDIAGYITNEQLIIAIRNKDILPQNSSLNGRIIMDAENYYIQSGDMPNINELVKKLQSL